MHARTIPTSASALLLSLALSACAATTSQTAAAVFSPAESAAVVEDPASFERDRQSIMAMAGDFDVSFDFTETVSFREDYVVMPQKISGAEEVVRVIEDRGDFISLQHILVASHGDTTFPIKHWRQDWQYEPERVLTFIGGNTWEWRDVPPAERAGAWSQTVYQVDDAPRYGAVARWSHQAGAAQWIPGHSWRPLPRRDMTTRTDYHAIDAINRHVITPLGWAHEQDNSKLVLSTGEPVLLAREIGVNIYERSDRFDSSVATEYWSATEGFWKEVRAEWDQIAGESDRFGLTIQGETEALYMPLLELASKVADGSIPEAEAVAKGRSTIRRFVTFEPAPLVERVAETPDLEGTE